MSDEAMVTERDAVERERAAYTEGAKWAWRTNYAECTGARFNHNGHVDRAAAYRYPLPKVTRPRVVEDARGTLWRVLSGELQIQRQSYRAWVAFSDGDVALTFGRIRLLADLLANPTEEVDG